MASASCFYLLLFLSSISLVLVWSPRLITIRSILLSLFCQKDVIYGRRTNNHSRRGGGLLRRAGTHDRIEVMVSYLLLSLWGTRFPKQKHNLSTLCALLRWYSPLLSSSKVAVELVIFVYCYTSFALSTVYSGFRVVVLNHQNIQHNNNQQLTNIPTNNHLKHHHPNHNKYTSR